MSSKVSRRRFLASAATGAAAGVAVTVTGSAQDPQQAPIPLPDQNTKASVDGTAPAECCTPANTIIFACSGAADVGKIADLTARKLTKDGCWEDVLPGWSWRSSSPADGSCQGRQGDHGH